MQKPFPEFDFPPFGAPDQIAYLVPSLVAAADQWSMLFDSGDDWHFYTYNAETLKELVYRDRPGDYSIRIAITTGIEPEVELIQPLQGPSIYHEWIRDRGYGLHHIGYFVDSLEEASGIMAARGYAPIQSGFGFGVDGDGGYVYFDTADELGVMLEFIELPGADPVSEEP